MTGLVLIRVSQLLSSQWRRRDVDGLVRRDAPRTDKACAVTPNGSLLHVPLMNRAFLGIVLCASFAWSGEARGCGGEQYMHGIIHRALPSPLPAGTLIADVEIAPDSNPAELFDSGLRARIRRLDQGEFRGDYVLLRAGRQHSCYFPFTNGRSGLIVGIPVGLDGDVLVVRPIEVGRNQGFRLPDGFQLRPQTDELLIE